MKLHDDDQKRVCVVNYSNIPQARVMSLSWQRAEARVKRTEVAEPDGTLVAIVDEGDLSFLLHRRYTPNPCTIPCSVREFCRDKVPTLWYEAWCGCRCLVELRELSHKFFKGRDAYV